MEQNLGFKQQLSQQQKLSYQMIQSINLLSIPTIELSEKIYEEVEKNPALEIVRDVSFENPTIKLNPSKKDYDTVSHSSDSDVFQSFLESSPSRNETLQENLLMQLRVSSLSEDEKSIAKRIIQSLDDKGYFLIPLEEMFSDFYQPVENSVENFTEKSVYQKALDVLPKIQKFYPIGIICKNLQESLEIQAKEKIEKADDIKLEKEINLLVLDILHNHFELLEKPRANLIHKKLNDLGVVCSLNQIELAIEFIRSLDPYPARNFSTEKSIYIRPDVFVSRLSEQELLQETDEETKKYPFKVELVKTNLPTVKISNDFLDYQENNPQIKKAVNDAKNFLNAVEQRNSTLLKVSVEIVKYQKDFFEKGSLYLKPLRLKDIANKIGVHETTVSRISNGKYLQCEWGLFELKYFFSNSVNENNDSQSKESIKQELLQILKSSGEKKLSDQKLSEKLAEKGINIARRTVAKYRKELNFDSSYDR
ncbi:MAG: RNA polymerase factor sigma-54 [Spirochaetaceae bacterium]|nr:RNA polymerase factor sigma-54 [Spirochaetaceae bacterium]